MITKKTYILTVLIFAFSVTVFGQSGTLLSQYSSNQIVYNPGYAGMFDRLCVNLSVHQTWVGLPGAPRLINFNGHAPFDKKHSWGWSYQHEKWGNLKENLLYGNYAYKVYMGQGVLNLGVQVGVFNRQVDWDALEHVPDPNDPSLRKGKTSTACLDANVGAYYKASNWYMGVSAQHLNNPKNNVYAQEGVREDTRMGTQFFLMGGYNQMLEGAWSLRPEMVLRYAEENPMSVNVGTQLYYQNDYGIGLNYMTTDKSLIFSVRLGVMQNIRIGYSYGVTFGSLRKYQKGSHEISANYTVRISQDTRADDFWRDIRRTKREY